MTEARCEMCGLPGVPGVRLVTDHCHGCGYVRGTLCSACNTQEAFSDDPKWIAWRGRCVTSTDFYAEPEPLRWCPRQDPDDFQRRYDAMMDRQRRITDVLDAVRARRR